MPCLVLLKPHIVPGIITSQPLASQAVDLFLMHLVMDGPNFSISFPDNMRTCHGVRLTCTYTMLGLHHQVLCLLSPKCRLILCPESIACHLGNLA